VTTDIGKPGTPSAFIVTIAAGVPDWRPAPFIVNVKLPVGISMVMRPENRNVSTWAIAWFDCVRSSCARCPSAPVHPATHTAVSRRVARRATLRMTP
jgi:hypothetical protein